MDIFELMKKGGHEQVIFNYDKATGMRAIIAIHDTTLGHACGGTRMVNYASIEDALKDAMRLSRAMTYKCAAADEDRGGGKGVIWGDPKKDKNEAFLRAYGRFIEILKGRFVTGAADLNLNEADGSIMGRTSITRLFSVMWVALLTVPSILSRRTEMEIPSLPKPQRAIRLMCFYH